MPPNLLAHRSTASASDAATSEPIENSIQPHKQSQCRTVLGQVQFVDMSQRSVVARGNHAKNKSHFTGRERFDHKDVQENWTHRLRTWTCPRFISPESARHLSWENASRSLRAEKASFLIDFE
jgi:hypothetical protein